MIPRDRIGWLLLALEFALVLCMVDAQAATKWTQCTNTCPPPTGIVSGLSPLNLYAVPVRWGAEVGSKNAGAWSWLKAGEPAQPCTAAQKVQINDRIACAARIGDVLMVTPRVRIAP